MVHWPDYVLFSSGPVHLQISSQSQHPTGRKAAVLHTYETNFFSSTPAKSWLAGWLARAVARGKQQYSGEGAAQSYMPTAPAHLYP